MFVFGYCGFIRAKVVVFGQIWLYPGESGCIRIKWFCLGKSCCIRAKWLYSGKVVVFGQSGCVREKVVVFGQRWLYSDKSGFILAKDVVYGQSCCIPAKVVVIGQSFYSGKVVVFGQKLLQSVTGCIRAKWFSREKWLYSGKSSCKRWLYYGTVVVFLQKLL